MIGCSGYQYVASPRYVPLNEKKGDININISLASAQLGYAFSNKFSAFATGFKRLPIDQSRQDNKPWRTCESGEVNLGFTYFGAKEKLHYEFVVGGGIGDMAFHSEKGHGAYSLNMQADKWNVFIQPNLSYKIGDPIGKHLAFAVFTKFNSVNYYNTFLTGKDYYDAFHGYDQRVTNLSPASIYDDGLIYFSNHEKSNLLFIEPGIFVKAGGKHFKALTQFSYVINAGGPSLYYQPYSITLGFAINFNVFELKAATQNKEK